MKKGKTKFQITIKKTLKSSKKNTNTETEDLQQQHNLALDSILKYHSENWSDKNYDEYDWVFMTDLYIKLRKEFNLSKNDFEDLKKRLNDDGLFIFDVPQQMLFLQTKGKLFWNNGRGGYVKEYKKAKTKHLYDNIIRWSKLAIAFVALCIALYKVKRMTNMSEAHCVKSEFYLMTSKTLTPPNPPREVCCGMIGVLK